MTKIDIAPEHIFKHTLHQITTVLRKPGVKKMPLVVRCEEDLYTCVRHMVDDTVAPIFLTSAVTGSELEN